MTHLSHPPRQTQQRIDQCVSRNFAKREIWRFKSKGKVPAKSAKDCMNQYVQRETTTLSHVSIVCEEGYEKPDDVLERTNGENYESQQSKKTRTCRLFVVPNRKWRCMVFANGIDFMPLAKFTFQAFRNFITFCCVLKALSWWNWTQTIRLPWHLTRFSGGDWRMFFEPNVPEIWLRVRYNPTTV